MSISAALVEANGWVLRLTVAAAPGSFASYVLDPNGTPRLTLAVRSPGFVRSGGAAVAGFITRSLLATTPIRRVVAFATPTSAVIDETDNGNGTITVRIALTEHVYQGDDQLSLSALAGWRSGLGGQSGISVTNNSTTARPVPIMRWALPSYTVSNGDVRLSIDVSSHHPMGFDPVAGVRFFITDGTRTLNRWVLAQATDNTHGDTLRCWTTVFTAADLAAAGVTAGLLRGDAEVYPWLGAMRSTDPAGIRSMTTLRSDGLSVNAASPFVVGYDPAGTRYSQMWAMVDPVNGTITAAAAMVATSLAGAKAVAAASRPRDVATAIQAGFLANRTLPAANGLASQTRSIDGMCIVLPGGGTAAMGSTAVTTGLATPEIPVRIIGDPDDSNPRSNCALNLTTAAINLRATRIAFASLALGLGTNAIASSATQTVWLDNVTAQGRSGLEANSSAFWAPAAASSQFNLFATRTRWWRHGAQMTGGNVRAGLVRACEHSRPVQGLAYLKNRFIGNVEDGFTGTTALIGWIGWGGPTLAGQAEDIVLKWNDLRFMRGRAFSWTYLPAATAGTPNPSLRRHAVVGNLLERIGASAEPLYSMGEDESVSASYNIIEANTNVGERTNTFYSDPLPAVLADCDAQANQALVNRIANNAYDWFPSKHDDFDDPTTRTIRTTAGGAETAKGGFRPQMIDAWSMLYGVGHEANVETRRVAGNNIALLEYYGPRGLGGAAVVASGALNPAYPDDRSNAGTGAGGGSYVPGAGSVLLGRVQNGQADVDAAGAARVAGSAAGAWRGPVVVTLAPDIARHGQQAGSPALALRFALAPQAARSGQQAGGPALALQLALAPHAAQSGQQAAAASLALRLALAPQNARSGQLAGSSALGFAGAGLLQPAGARHVLRDAGTVPLLPAVDMALVPLQAVGPTRQVLLVPKAF